MKILFYTTVILLVIGCRSQNKVVSLVKYQGKFGFIKKDCSVAADFQFQDADGFKYGLAAVKINDKWGFINANGDFVLKPKYEKVVHQFRPIKANYEPMYDYQRR